MSIKNYAGMNNTLRNYDSQGWLSKAELSNKIDFNSNELTTGNPEKTQSFGDFLSDSISQVNALQQDANVAMEKIASGDSRNLHETLLAVEKADIALKTMNQIRSKVIDAYKEIMRMQI